MERLAPHFVAHLAPSLRESTRPDERLEEALRSTLEAARNEHPEVDVPDDEFAAHAAARIGADEDPLQSLSGLCGSDLYLACGCTRGNRAAVEKLQRGPLREVLPALRRFNPSEFFVDDVLQAVSELVLVGGPDGNPKIRQYGGRGTLRGWLRVIALREAGRMASRFARERPTDDEALTRAVVADSDAELMLLKVEYRDVFKQQFHKALKALSAFDRLVLRQHLIDGLSIDRLASKHKIHRATAARWLGKIRQALFQKTRKGMQSELKIDADSFNSLMQLIGSRLQASIERVLDGRPTVPDSKEEKTPG